MSYDALRKGRYSASAQIYSITSVTQHRTPWFRDFTVARLLIREIRSLHENGIADSLAWVVMPDHFHWLFQLQQQCSLPSAVKILKARSAVTINRQMNRQGRFWQRAYFDRAIRKDEDIRKIARYIVANPLRAHLVESIGDYPHWDCIWLTGQDDQALVE